MYNFKISQKGKNNLPKKMDLQDLEREIEKKIERIADALQRNEVQIQKLIKRDDTFTKILKNLVKYNDKKIKKAKQKIISKELKRYIQENGYIKLDSGVVLVYKNHEVFLLNK